MLSASLSLERKLPNPLSASKIRYAHRNVNSVLVSSDIDFGFAVLNLESAIWDLKSKALG